MEKKTNIIRSPLFNETRLESIGSKFSSISNIISDIMQIKIDKEIFIGNDFEAKKLYNCLFHKLNNNINSNDNKEDLSDQYNGQILQKVRMIIMKIYLINIVVRFFQKIF